MVRAIGCHRQNMKTNIIYGQDEPWRFNYYYTNVVYIKGRVKYEK